MPRIKQAVALVIRQKEAPSRVLVVRRPQGPGEELPGIWGLPAASLRTGEGPQEAARRIARQKLGTQAHILRELCRGEQQRQGYLLRMRLYEAELTGPEPSLPNSGALESSVTYYTAWQWIEPSILQEGASKGSLCCRLLLETAKQA
ncbi:MAG: NUDIX hydrolase [Dehalococcoidia bacterium]